MLTRKWNWTKTNETETGRSCRSGWQQRLNGRCEGQTAFLYAGCSLRLSQCCIAVVANFSRPATEPSFCNGGVRGECLGNVHVAALSVAQRSYVVCILHILFKGLSHSAVLTIRWRYNYLTIRLYPLFQTESTRYAQERPMRYSDYSASCVI